ncbi:hypothetical protein GQ53DRAFT_86083 [Thozetella sp. PMI_491]|nr:hypothetical protein GQ53DRAFT_86083 [Thozetella sp. PMI_491]
MLESRRLVRAVKEATPHRLSRLGPSLSVLTCFFLCHAVCLGGLPRRKWLVFSPSRLDRPAALPGCFRSTKRREQRRAGGGGLHGTAARRQMGKQRTVSPRFV